jgi:hypothetical protein
MREEIWGKSKTLKSIKKTLSLLENVDDIIIDRGYASAFELHYKIGEVNTFEDLENYQNNIFGL